MKFLVYFLLLLLLTSCSFRTLEGRVWPVYFSADSVVITDTLVPIEMLTYQNLMRLGSPYLEVVDLQKGNTVKAFIARPTIFRKDNKEFLVYPREHIFITATDSNEYIPIFSTVGKNKVRDDELLVLRTFQELEKKA